MYGHLYSSGSVCSVHMPGQPNMPSSYSMQQPTGPPSGQQPSHPMYPGQQQQQAQQQMMSQQQAMMSSHQPMMSQHQSMMSSSAPQQQQQPIMTAAGSSASAGQSVIGSSVGGMANQSGMMMSQRHMPPPPTSMARRSPSQTSQSCLSLSYIIMLSSFLLSPRLPFYWPFSQLTWVRWLPLGFCATFYASVKLHG